MQKSKKINLSVVILNYNAGSYLAECLKSISESDLGKYRIEVIVVDSNSRDDSMMMAKKEVFGKSAVDFKFVELNENRGFSAGNNKGLDHTDKKSDFVLFLNPDTTVDKDTFRIMLEFFEKTPLADAATCKLILAKTGEIQKECHRGFPTPWRGFWHFFGFGLPKIFPKSATFNGYFLGHLDMRKTHQIEACSGAFLMVKREVGEAIGWWNEKYFMYGEDLDFGYKLWQKGYKLYYVSETEVLHYQGISSGIKTHSASLTKASKETKMRSAVASIVAMRIFYEENLSQRYPWLFNQFVLSGIRIMEILRKMRIKLQ